MELTITRVTDSQRKPIPTDDTQLGFGRYFSDHMFLYDYSPEKGWHDPRIEPYRPLALDPATMVLHYGQEAFEGLKAYRGADGGVRVFRHRMNLDRLLRSARRLCMPAFDVDDMASGLVRFRGDAALHLEASWCANVIDQGGGVELFGTKGGVKLSPGGTATVIRESKGALVTEEIKPAGGGYDWEMQHFVQCIRTGKQPLATAEQGLRVMKILDAVYKSAARGKEVAIR